MLRCGDRAGREERDRDRARACTTNAAAAAAAGDGGAGDDGGTWSPFDPRNRCTRTDLSPISIVRTRADVT